MPDERVPINIREKIYDEVFVADKEGAFAAAQEVAKTDGILVGISSGAALWGALQIVSRPEYEGKKIVVVFPDTGLRYLSTDLFKG